MICFTIPGEPIPKARHRTFTRNGFTRAYDPQEKEKRRVQKFLAAQMNVALNDPDKAVALQAAALAKDNALDIEMNFYMPIRKSETQASRNAKLWGFENHTSKPDLDNLEKFYLDCGNGIIYPDDRYVVSVKKKKLYSKNPRTEIKIMQKKKHNLSPVAQGILIMFGPEKLQEFLAHAAKFIPLMQKNPEIFRDNDEEVFLEATSRLLSDFANKWYADLARIHKKFPQESDTRIQINLHNKCRPKITSIN